MAFKERPYRKCNEVNASVLRALEANPPRAVITSQTITRALDGDKMTREAMVRGLASRWTKLRDLGIDVIVLADNPRPATTVYKCLLKYPDDPTKCAFERQRAVRRSCADVQKEAAKQVPGVHVIDPLDFICPKSDCAPVIGGVLIYRQGSHLTNTYVRSLAPWLTEQLARYLGHA